VLDRLLERYLELEHDERPAFVDRVRSQWPRLAHWFVPLAEESRTTTSLLSHWPAPIAEELIDEKLHRETPVMEPGTRLGPWRITEYVDAGGMGKVYRGERADGAFEKHVAIKLIGSLRPGLADQLRQESHLLARLDHPTVTRLIDAGLTDSDEPYLVMEWVEGSDLEDWLKANEVGLDQRLELFLDVARAVAHAHQRLIVHGDIKPGNIRVTLDGRVKLLDFGVARLLEDDAAAGRTAALTPAFASPEQREGGALTTRSDVWSLGTLLYWMLTDRILDRQQPPAEQVSLPAALTRKREVEAIIIKACARHPEDRYQSAEALINDLQRYLARQPVDAVPATRGYLLGLFIGRNRMALAAASAVLLLLVAGIVGVAWQAEQTRHEALRAQAEADRARAAAERTAAVRDFLIDMIAESSPYVSPGETPTVRDILERARDSVGDELAEQPDLAAEILGVIGNSYIGLGDRPTAREVLAEAIDLFDARTVPRLDAATVARIRYDYAFAMEDPDISPKQARLALKELGQLEGHELLRADLKRLIAYTHLMAGEARRAEALIKQAVHLTCGEKETLREACIVNSYDSFYYHRIAGNKLAAYEAAKWAYEAARDFYDPDPHPHLIDAGLAYSEALTDQGQPDSAIELLKSLRQIALTAFEGQSTVYSAIGFRLAGAHATTGRDTAAVTIWEHTLQEIAEQDPQSNAIPVQLNFLARTLLDLLQLEEVEEIYERFEPHLGDGVRVAAVDLRRLNKLNREWRQGGDQPALIASLENLITDLQSRQDLETAVLQNALLQRLSWAVDATNLVDAHSWKLNLDAWMDPESRPAAYYRASARYYTLAGQVRKALAAALRSLEIHDKNQEHTGPRLARTRAVKAGIRCLKGDPERGRELLEQSLAFWEEAQQTRRGQDRMRRLASGCSAP